MARSISISSIVPVIWAACGVAATTVAVATAVPHFAYAQASESSGEEAAGQARRAHAAGRLNEAIDGYARAYQLGGDPEMLFNLAEVHRLAGHDNDALRTFQTYLRRDPQGVHHESAEKQMRELDQKLHAAATASAAPVAPVAPPAAAAASKPTVTPPPAAPSPPVSPPRTVAAPVAPPPPAPALSPPPPTTPAGVDLLATARANYPTTSSPPLPRWVPWTLAVATVGVGTGAILSGLSASNRFDELKNSCGQTAQGCESAAVDEVRSRARRANILWAATGVLAVATGVTVYVNADAAGASGLWAF